MDLSIRDATERDLEAILEIYNDQILHGTATFHTQPQTIAQRAEWLAGLRAEGYPCLVAEITEEDSSGVTGGRRTVAWCNLWHFNLRPAYDT